MFFHQIYTPLLTFSSPNFNFGQDFVDIDMFLILN